jgi:hypothetical protein
VVAWQTGEATVQASLDVEYVDVIIDNRPLGKVIELVQLTSQLRPDGVYQFVDVRKEFGRHHLWHPSLEAGVRNESPLAGVSKVS